MKSLLGNSHDRLTLCLILACLLSACAGQTVPTPTLPSPTQLPTIVPTLTAEPLVDESLPGSLEISLRIVRQGQVYPLVLGHDLGEAFFKATPKPELPDWYLYDRNIVSSSLEWYGDLDTDGETEYLVTYSSRAAGCYNGVLAVDYDAEKDEYRVFDELAGPCAVVGALEDLDGDGIPEVRARNAAVYYNMGGIGDGGLLSPIEIYRYDGQAFAVVTAQFPALVEEDIDHWLLMLEGSGSASETDLLLAAILLDRSLLGEREAGSEEFNSLCARYAVPQRRPEGWTCQTLLDQILSAIDQP